MTTPLESSSIIRVCRRGESRGGGPGVCRRPLQSVRQSPGCFKRRNICMLRLLSVSKGVTSVCFVMYNVVRLKDSKGVKAVCSKSRFCGEAGEAVYAVWREIIWPVAGHTPQHFRS